jgi:superfamily I DNA/RNA helicase
MHYAKGLEFEAVVVMGCDEDKLPLRERVKAAGTRWNSKTSTRPSGGYSTSPALEREIGSW